MPERSMSGDGITGNGSSAGPANAKQCVNGSDSIGSSRRKALLVYHSDGIYQVSPSNGSYTKVSNEGWSRVKASAYDNDNTIYVFHSDGIFRVMVDSGTYTRLSGEGWFATTAAVYARGNLIVFHANGIFQVKPNNGAYSKISSERWLRVKAAVYDNGSTINVFHDGGIFQVNVDESSPEFGSYKTLSWRGWSATKAAVYVRDSLIVFHADGIFRVNTNNGSYTKLSSECWSLVRAAAYDDDNTISVFHDGGIFQVSVDNGSYTMLSRESWSATKAAVCTKGKILLDGQPPRHKEEKRGVGISCATFLVVTALVWAEYGPVVGRRWKILRDCIAVAAVLYLAVWSWSPTERPRPLSVSPPEGAGRGSSENSENDPESEVEDPMRWSFLPSGSGVRLANTKSPATHEDDFCKMKILPMHRPTHEAWREDMGNYPYSWHFSGRSRVWEIRVQMRFKRIPTTSPLYFGIEMRYVPFTLSPWLIYFKNLLLKMMGTAIGGKIYQTPGEDPATVVGEAEPPTFAMPCWAFDQFHVANPGEEPDLTGDLAGIGLRRTDGLNKYIQALKAELANLSTEKVYTFCFWGISRFADAIHWEVRAAGFKVDASKLCGKPPVYVAIYELPGVKPEDKDQRHLISRKRYYMRVAVWNASKPFEESEVRSLTENGDQGDTKATQKKRKFVGGTTFGAAEWFGCCTGQMRCSGSPVSSVHL